MKLSIMERLVLMGVLPTEGNFVTLRIVRDLQKELSFSEDELKRYKITQTSDNKVTWDEKAAADKKDVQIGERAEDIIVNALEDLDKKQKLTPSHLDLYEKFVKKDKAGG